MDRENFSQNDAFDANQGKDTIEEIARDNLTQLIRKFDEILIRKDRKQNTPQINEVYSEERRR
jgi:F0F1-type ATP synthase delta subunit